MAGCGVVASLGRGVGGAEAAGLDQAETRANALVVPTLSILRSALSLWRPRGRSGGAYLYST